MTRIFRLASIKTKRSILLAALVLVFAGLSRLPYVNLVLTNTVMLFVLWVAFTFVWKVGERIQFALALIFLVVALGCVLGGKPDIAEQLGNLAYVLLTIGTIQAIRALSTP